jgi:hypothetical protein
VAASLVVGLAFRFGGWIGGPKDEDSAVTLRNVNARPR